MFWKVVGGIFAFMSAVVLGAILAITFGVTALGAAVGAIAEEMSFSTIQVTDENGNVETFAVDDFVSESGTIEVIGDAGERVTIDLAEPQITIQEGGIEAPEVVLGRGSTIEISPNVPEIVVDGRHVTRIERGFGWHPIASIFRGIVRLAAWTLIAVGVWLVVRNKRNNQAPPVEKTPNAAA